MNSEEGSGEEITRGLEGYEAEGVWCRRVRGGIREHGFNCGSAFGWEWLVWTSDGL